MKFLLELINNLFKSKKVVKDTPKIEVNKNMVAFKNDQKRLKDEYDSLKLKNKLLYDLMEDLQKWVEKEFSKDILITMIFRTQAEQEAIYSFSEAFKKKPFKSPHQFYHSVDLRTWIYTADEIVKITDYINNKHNSSNYYKWTAKNHKVGNGADHFHIQYYKK